MTRLCDALGVPGGVTAVVGGGGKTSLIDRLCDELKIDGKVLRLTTAHCRPPCCACLYAPTAEALEAAFRSHDVVAIGKRTAEGKLARPETDLEALFSLADYVLIEADGSRGLPLKAPADHEPALTGLEKLVIAVAGATGMERPIGEAAHRPERYAALTGRTINDCPLPQDVAHVLESPRGQRKNVTSSFAVVLNQCDTPERLALARACAEQLHASCVLTALCTKPEWMEQWRKKKC